MLNGVSHINLLMLELTTGKSRLVTLTLVLCRRNIVIGRELKPAFLAQLHYTELTVRPGEIDNKC